MRIIVLLFASVALLAVPASTSTTDRSAVIVHEWGTFTSIAGTDGTAVEWLPQAGPTDLPCFVERNRFNGKLIPATVRMARPHVFMCSWRAFVARSRR